MQSRLPLSLIRFRESLPCQCIFSNSNRAYSLGISRNSMIMHTYIWYSRFRFFVSCRSGPLQIWSLLTLHVVYLTRRTSRAPIMPLCCRDHEYNCSRRTHACLFIVNSLFSLIFIIEQIDPAFALGPSRSLYASIT